MTRVFGWIAGVVCVLLGFFFGIAFLFFMIIAALIAFAVFIAALIVIDLITEPTLWGIIKKVLILMVVAFLIAYFADAIQYIASRNQI